MKKSKLILTLSTALGVFATFVATISTFAWIQLEEKVDTGIETGSDPSGVGVTVSDVTAYKYSYNQTNSTTTNYATGSVISHVANGDAASSNKDQEGNSPLDAPGEGLGAGYFIIPNDDSSGEDSFRYSNDNVVQLVSVDNSGGVGLTLSRTERPYTFSNSTKYRVKQYSFTTSAGRTITVNNKISITAVTIDGAAGSASTITYSDGDIIVGSSGGETYNTWLINNGSSWEIALETAQNIPTINRSKISNHDSTKSMPNIPSGNKRIYLDPNGNGTYTTSNAHIYYWGGSSNSWPGDGISGSFSKFGRTIMYFDIPSAASNVQFNQGNSANQVEATSIGSYNYFQCKSDSDKSLNWFIGYKATLNYASSSGGTLYDVAVNWGSYTPDDGQKTNFLFKRWCTNSTLTTAYSASTPSADLNLYAQYYDNRTYYLLDSHKAAGLDPIMGNTLYALVFKGGSGAWVDVLDGANLSGPTNGMWTITISQYYDSTYTGILFATDKSYTIQTVDVTLDTSKPYMTILNSKTDGKYNVSKSASNYTTTAVTGAGNTHTFNFIDQQSWGSVSVHMWTDGFYYTNDADGFQGWPGKSVTPVDGVYTVTASKSFTSIILSNSAGTKQTINLEASDSNDGKYFVIQGKYSDSDYTDHDGDGSSDNGKYYGTWQTLDALDFQLVYFDQSGNKLTGVCTTLGTTSGITPASGVPYSSIVLKSGGNYNYLPNSKAWFDDTNKILYYFPQASFAGWYSTSACTGAELTSKSLSDSSDVVYGKMICNTSSSNLKAVYVDNKVTTTNWLNVGFHVWNLGTFDFYDGSSWNNGINNVNVGPAKKLANNLYRIVLPSCAEFNCLQTNGSGTYWTGDYNQTTDISSANSNALADQVSGSILRITRYGNEFLPIDWVNNVGAGVTATIVKNGSDEFEMGVGDGTYNNYVYASGIDFAVGDYFTISLSDSTTKNYSNLDKDYSAFVTNDSGNIKFTKAGKYAFYITTSGSLAIASVPSHGNGYYICEDPTLYYNSIKMETIDSPTNKARYMDFSLTSSKTIYIRSYLDGIENEIKKYGTMADGITYSQDTAAITLPKGNYNIYVYLESTTLKISIVNFNTSDFMKLNAADPTSMANSSAVQAQNTSLVIEAKVVLTGSKNSSISVDVDIEAVLSGYAASNYLKAACYVSSSQLPTPYETTRSNAYSSLVNLTNSNPATATTISLTPAGGSGSNKAAGTYYVYILIDYKPGIGSTLTSISSTGMTSNMSFRITANQY